MRARRLRSEGREYKLVENSNRTGIESRMMCGAASSFLYKTEKVMMETKRNANHDVVRTKMGNKESNYETFLGIAWDGPW